MTVKIRMQRLAADKFLALIAPARVRVWTWVEVTNGVGIYADAGKSVIRDAIGQLPDTEVKCYCTLSRAPVFRDTGRLLQEEPWEPLVEAVYVGGPHPDPWKRSHPSLEQRGACIREQRLTEGMQVTWRDGPNGMYRLAATVKAITAEYMVSLLVERPSTTILAAQLVEPRALQPGWPETEVRWDDGPSASEGASPS